MVLADWLTTWRLESARAGVVDRVGQAPNLAAALLEVGLLTGPAANDWHLDASPLLALFGLEPSRRAFDAARKAAGSATEVRRGSGVSSGGAAETPLASTLPIPEQTAVCADSARLKPLISSHLKQNPLNSGLNSARDEMRSEPKARARDERGPEETPEATRDSGHAVAIPEPEAVRTALRRHGVNGVALAFLPTVPGMTAAAVDELAASVNRDVADSPAGVLVSLLCDRYKCDVPSTADMDPVVRTLKRARRRSRNVNAASNGHAPDRSS